MKKLICLNIEKTFFVSKQEIRFLSKHNNKFFFDLRLKIKAIKEKLLLFYTFIHESSFHYYYFLITFYSILLSILISTLSLHESRVFDSKHIFNSAHKRRQLKGPDCLVCGSRGSLLLSICCMPIAAFINRASVL